MSTEAFTAVLHHSRAKGTDKVVLIGIANHHNPSDGTSWPSISTLAKYANASERSVSRSIANLVALGELSYGKNAAPTTHYNKPNLYQILVGCPAECDGTYSHKEGPRTGMTNLVGMTSVVDRDDKSGKTGMTPVSSEPKEETKEKLNNLPRGTRIPEDFSITEKMRVWAKENHPNVDLEKTTLNFIDYWTSKPTNATKLDWVSTWRVWIRNTKPEMAKTMSRRNAKVEAQQEARARFLAAGTQTPELNSRNDWNL